MKSLKDVSQNDIDNACKIAITAACVVYAVGYLIRAFR